MTKHPHEKSLTKAVQVLQQANKAVNALFEHPELLSIKMFVEAQQVKNINYLQTLLGEDGQKTEAETLPVYGPVTNFLGKKIERQKAVATADLQPGQNEREKFIAERDALYASFPDLKNEDLIAKCRLPGGESLIRACAKKAGLGEYKDREIDIVFLDEIRKHIAEEKAMAEELANVEKNLNK